MQGFEVLWMPGTDHAGIATQAVVERLLAAENKGFNRREYGREKLVEKIWEWKDKYGGIILNQVRKLGYSVDWSKERFTLQTEKQESLNIKSIASNLMSLYQKFI